MKVHVIPVCIHPDGFRDRGEVITGSHATIGSFGVYLDGHMVLERDRRIKRNREPGHPWISQGAGWTTFEVLVEPHE